MPNIEVKLRRGTEAEHDTTSGGFTGAEGEVTVDTTNDTLRVHDGSTVGGIRLAKLSEVSAGGGGTVTSVGTGAGLSGGPITTSGTLSLAVIPGMKALGNVKSTPDFPVPITILDEDAMTSDSATSLATQQSIKAYVDSQVSSQVSKHDTGWVSQDDQGTPVSLGNGNELVFTHSLGSTAVSVQLYASDATQSVIYDPKVLISGFNHYGAQVTGLTSNTVSVRLAKNGAAYLVSSNFNTGITWGAGNAARIRLIITK
jgi:hypothetical protein